jgi:ethanolamine permease
MAQNVEFVFAPPAIAFAIGAYFNLFVPDLPILGIAILGYMLFTALNIYGVKAAATFELVITVLAVVELLIFAGMTLPSFEWNNVTRNGLPHGWTGAFASIPFAIWFFLGIEGVANVAEESLNPRRTIILGFGSAIFTLIVLCILTFLSAVGVAGWEKIVYTDDGTVSNSPLPMALSHIVSTNDVLYHLLITVGLFGLVASFHGIILAAGRSTFEFGRGGNAPAFVGRVHPKFQTPANALIVNMIIGVIALLTGKTDEIITIAVFGALTLYIIAMLSLLKLRITEPLLDRPFKVPGYPVVPLIALTIATVSLLALIVYNVVLFLIYALVIAASFMFYKISRRRKLLL